MFAGLLLTSISTATMRAALFQRKSRTGWLEELDEIREQAVDESGNEVGHVTADVDDIWTDLRDGGEYADPHEISSLYATDATPDLPTAKTPPKPSRAAKDPAKAKARTRTRPSAISKIAEAAANARLPEATDLPPIEPVSPAAAIDDVWPMNHEAPTGTQYDSDQIWVQPAPHPIRPSEMWHPAELAPSPLGEETYEQIPEERVGSAELDDANPVEAAFARYQATEAEAILQAQAVDPAAAAQLEQALEEVAAAEAVDAAAGLVAGPVGRRVRRDRPAEPKRASLPVADGPREDLRIFDRGERSPLPEQPLPPAALPTRANRLPSMKTLPETPSSVVPPNGSSAFDLLPSPAALEPTPAPVDDAPDAVVPQVEAPEAVVADDAVAEPVVEATPEPEAFDPAALVVEEVDLAAGPIEEDEPVAEIAPLAAPEVIEVTEPVVAPEPVAAPAPQAPPSSSIAVDASGLAAVAGTIVRLGGAVRGSADRVGEAVMVVLIDGWCWVSPGDGDPVAVRVVMPNGTLNVEPGATALAVVESDRSAFVIVASGNADLRRGDDGGPLGRGAIVMIDPSGAAQLDRATDAEIEADPIVAENLSLDAEL